MRKGRSLDEVKLPPWTKIAFTDLHYSGKTMERGLRVLAHVRELAIEHKAGVVFCGDFFDTRGVLAIRQIDPLLDEFYRWRDAGIQFIMVPGNHDQVTMDGKLHGVRIFEPFQHIEVATEPLLIPHRKLAFLPWREEPGEQAALFDNLKGGDWTIFGHAEIRGARTNYGFEAPGRVSIEQIERASRACYLGHFHLRQKHGAHTWYLGNPFELTFGEMGEPKGVALISEDRVEPLWIELDGFPRHHRLTYREPADLSGIAEQDVVEVYAQPDDLGTEEFQAFIENTVPATDVRPLPLDTDAPGTAPPEFALSLDEAIDRYVDEGEVEGEEDTVGPMCEELKRFGRSILAELPEAKAILPLTPQVVIQGVNVSDFCAIKGDVSLSLDNQGLMLLKGPVGIGKTSIADAITWCLHGQTSPRKVGATGSTFRGDEVIHDHANECLVTVQIALPLLKKSVLVKRVKERGKGAKVEVQGIDMPSGISDTQDLINHIVGMDYALWRTCVSLGQGAVGNFVTDADKARKLLLSGAFGLGACPIAQKFVRDRLKPLRVQVDKLTIDIASEQRALEAIEGADYAEQMQLWEGQRNATKEAAKTAGEQQAVTVAECDEQLKQKGTWETLKKKHDQHVEGLQKQLSGLVAGDTLLALEREHGGYSAEQSILKGQHAKTVIEHAELEAAFQKSTLLPCPTCGQTMKNTQSEALVAGKAKEVQSLDRSVRTFASKMKNVGAKINDLKRGTETRRAEIEHQLNESREALTKCGTALSTFTRFEANKAEAERRLAESRALWKQKDDEINPFKARADEHEVKLDQLRMTIGSMTTERDEAGAQMEKLEFWDVGFGAKGLPVLVLRTALHELELFANRFLGQFLGGRIHTQLEMLGDDLGIRLFERCDDGEVRERRYETLSGGMRRCVELAFAPFALSEMVFNRCGVRIPLLIIDELTTHLGQEEKPLVCEVLRSLGRDTVLVIDHDVHVQGEFDHVLEVTRNGADTEVKRAA